MTALRAIGFVSVVFAACVCTRVLAQAPIGLEVAIAAHLAEGDEFAIPLKDLLDHGLRDNTPFGIVGGGGDIAANVFVLGQRFDFATMNAVPDGFPTKGTSDENLAPVNLQNVGNSRAAGRRARPEPQPQQPSPAVAAAARRARHRLGARVHRPAAAQHVRRP
jgi:hypothetical protein